MCLKVFFFTIRQRSSEQSIKSEMLFLLVTKNLNAYHKTKMPCHDNSMGNDRMFISELISYTYLFRLLFRFLFSSFLFKITVNNVY